MIESKEKMKCYCVNCKQEEEMIVTNEIILYNNREKKINGHCKVCSELMCLIEI